MNGAAQDGAGIERLGSRALMMGGAGLAACLAGAAMDREQFFRSYLLGFVFVAAVPLGCLALFMLHNMSGGGWGFVIRRVLEAGTRTFPVLLALFVPVAFAVVMDGRSGMGEDGKPHWYLYEWANAEVVKHDKLLEYKSVYLNVQFFLTRAAGYFLVWLALAYFLNRWSAQQDANPGEGGHYTRRMQYLSGTGLLLYGLTVTFACVDWVMSLEPHWFSTMYGLMFIVGQGLTTLCFAVLMLRKLAGCEPLAGIVRPSHYHDLGNLMLTFVILWAYIAYSQYLIIWSGNLPEENVWYLRRTGDGWQILAIFLIAFHFAVPFMLLLSRKLKRQPQTIARLAVALLAMRLLDMIWLIKPAFTHPGEGGEIVAHFSLHWLDFAAPMGIGGIWLWAFAWQLQKRPLVPAGDPRLAEILAHAHGH